jgi:sulfur-oxidizing protein SoxY
MMLLPRRRWLIGASGIVLAGLAPARATESEVAQLIKELVGDATLTPGRVKLDIPLLVENGNAVSMTVAVDGAPAAGPERVASLHVFAERNPLPHVINATFGPRSGRPKLATRIRLATSQTVIAVAKLQDGSCWSDSIELLVTLAACIE